MEFSGNNVGSEWNVDLSGTGEERRGLSRYGRRDKAAPCTGRQILDPVPVLEEPAVIAEDPASAPSYRTMDRVLNCSAWPPEQFGDPCDDLAEEQRLADCQ